LTSTNVEKALITQKKRRLPVRLVYFEEFTRVDKAFYREKQIQNWSHDKKVALINGDQAKLKILSKKVFTKQDLSQRCHRYDSDEKSESLGQRRSVT